MKFLSFTTDFPGFRREGDRLIWPLPGRVLEQNVSEIALSSCLFHFNHVNGKQLPMVLTCSLVDESSLNYDGTIGIGTSEFKNFLLHPENLEFWRLDCSRPRNVVFALRGVSADDVKFGIITLALR